ncbi:superoxide dismutase family protein [Amycolatopsis albispora]|uniref:Superoxide dismutase copper/zinc binding domain-containing protein n=1 Tax=Amycolatopsis albispora TaxID=1804986 RepID=A0A344L9E4_9PSEU|nr:superoxide dismutase family protein [Amycolatopsis albispora]AXB44668.1 hypothetical protein A4R43_20965 [Amycolatopsis albispora]
MRLLACAAAAGLLVTGCGDEPDGEDTGEQPPAGGVNVQQEGKLAPPEQASNAFTYDQAAAPAGATLDISAKSTPTGTLVEFGVDGMAPSRGYAVHLHAKPCGPTGDAAGPHYQNRLDPAATPEQPSKDPAYANPQNEFWLDLRTNEQGDAETRTEVPFGFSDRVPASVVVHAEEKTATEHGKAGQAGGRVACLTVPFR